MHSESLTTPGAESNEKAEFPTRLMPSYKPANVAMPGCGMSPLRRNATPEMTDRRREDDRHYEPVTVGAERERALDDPRTWDRPKPGVGIVSPHHINAAVSSLTAAYVSMDHFTPNKYDLRLSSVWSLRIRDEHSMSRGRVRSTPQWTLLETVIA